MKEQFDFYSKTSLKSYNLNETMRYQLSMLDSLDAYSRVHSENVANITCRICEYMKLNKEFTVYATICAYLHDIGKLFVPAEILQKPGALTESEYEVMKRHTIIGYEMCREDLKLRPYSAGTIYHHESLNGTGYPKGLTKKEIPIEGQIIRVADEFDAIVSKRQYKTHVGVTETLKYLIKETESTLPKSVALKSMEESSKIGRLNSKVVKHLFKVVIEDIEYEISCIFDYTKYLRDEIERLEKISQYHIKMEKARSDKKKSYFEEGMKLLLNDREDFRNYKYVLEEYRTALLKRKEIINNLFDEIKQIKKLRV
ncbi:MAG: HD domain-containing protein [Oscillospiraceae bacterium]|nr:HD domain-containing protein [Oscillospiraceae bacterium]